MGRWSIIFAAVLVLLSPCPCARAVPNAILSRLLLPRRNAVAFRLRGGGGDEEVALACMPEDGSEKQTTKSEARALSKKAWKEIRRRKFKDLDAEEKLSLADGMLAAGDYKGAADIFSSVANVTLVPPRVGKAAAKVGNGEYIDKGNGEDEGSCKTDVKQEELGAENMRLVLREPRYNLQVPYMHYCCFTLDALLLLYSSCVTGQAAARGRG